MEKICCTTGRQFGPKIKKVNPWLGADGHAEGIGCLIGATFIEASEKNRA